MFEQRVDRSGSLGSRFVQIVGLDVHSIRKAAQMAVEVPAFHLGLAAVALVAAFVITTLSGVRHVLGRTRRPDAGVERDV